MSSAYRDPSVLVAPGRVFRTARWLILTTLVVMAVVAALCFLGRVAFDYCNDHYFLWPEQCRPLDLSPQLHSIGVPPSWQGALTDVPASVPAMFFIVDALVALFLVRPRTATLDLATRTLLLKISRWPRRPTAVRLRVDEIDVVEVRVTWRVLFTVRLVDARGMSHVVSGLGFGRKRAESIARALEEAAGLEALPDDEWLCAVRAVRETNDLA